MAYDYSTLAATALRLINDKGRALTVREVTGTQPDPAKPWEGGETLTDHAVTGVVVDYEQGEIDGTTIRAGDRKALVAGSALSVVPKPGWRVLDGSASLTVIRVEQVKPGATVLLWTLQVRN